MNKNLKVFKLNKLSKPISSQSQEWVKRHLNDEFVKKARKDGYISRAAYKLLEIQQKYKLIQPHHVIVELGSAPGGWSQVTVDLLKTGIIFAIDLLPMSFCNEKLYFIQGNFETDAQNVIQEIENVVGKGEKVNGILSDMCPHTSGDSEGDHLKIMNLCDATLRFSFQVLENNGYLITKILMGGEMKDFIEELKKCFRKVLLFKPKASRQASREMYLIAIGFRNPN
jgi:23S rRNA (uridine2552-2'-O)-methyltransferase